jgi:hypothetical protein
VSGGDGQGVRGAIVLMEDGRLTEEE